MALSLSLEDGNFKADVQRQAVESLINQKPDVLVVQSLNQTNLARVIKRPWPREFM